MTPEKLAEYLIYEPLTGNIRLRKNNRILIPDAYGFISLYIHKELKKHKLKVDKVAYELGNNRKVPASHRVLHKNLREEDNRLVNLTTVHRQTMRKINEAVRNLNGYLRMVPHPEDQFLYYIEYQDNGIYHRELRHDIVTARQHLLKLQLKFAKLLNKYCIFD
jgi:hypothetical protein